MADRPDTEALARALCAAAGLNPDALVFPLGLTRYWQQAERILADPGPLLAALAEAGVLADESRKRITWLYDDHAPIDNSLVTERRYMSEWRPR